MLNNKESNIAMGIAGIAILGILFWKYKCQISAKFNLNLCEDVSHKINYDVENVVEDTTQSM